VLNGSFEGEVSRAGEVGGGAGRGGGSRARGDSTGEVLHGRGKEESDGVKTELLPPSLPPSLTFLPPPSPLSSLPPFPLRTFSFAAMLFFTDFVPVFPPSTFDSFPPSLPPSLPPSSPPSPSPGPLIDAGLLFPSPSSPPRSRPSSSRLPCAAIANLSRECCA